MGPRDAISYVNEGYTNWIRRKKREREMFPAFTQKKVR